MANKGYLESLLNALPDNVKNPVTQAFRYFADNISAGQPDDMDRATNFRWYRFTSTTSSVANLEFSIHHGQGTKPIWFFPVAFLDSSGGQIVRLNVTRAADAQRIYLSSPDTSASLTIFAEF